MCFEARIRSVLVSNETFPYCSNREGRVHTTSHPLPPHRDSPRGNDLGRSQARLSPTLIRNLINVITLWSRLWTLIQTTRVASSILLHSSYRTSFTTQTCCSLLRSSCGAGLAASDRPHDEIFTYSVTSIRGMHNPDFPHWYGDLLSPLFSQLLRSNQRYFSMHRQSLTKRAT